MSIEYMNGYEMVQAAENVTQAVSGMSPAEAAAALQSAQYVLTGGQNILSFPMTSQAAENVVRSGESAAQAWQYYAQEVDMGLAGMSVLGAAARGGVKWAQGVLFGDPATAGTLAGAGGLLTSSLPAAAASFAPFFGISLGTTFYQLNPELWTEISQTLLPFCYEDSFTIPYVYDPVSGCVYAAEQAILALKNLFESKGIGNIKNQQKMVGDEVVEPFFWREVSAGIRVGNQVLRQISGTDSVRVAIMPTDSGIRIICSSLTQGNELRFYNPETQGWGIGVGPTTYGVTIDGRTCYTSVADTSSPAYVSTMLALVGISAVQTLSNSTLQWMMQFGSSVPGGVYPQGTKAWTGDIEPEIDPSKEKEIITDPDGNTIKYYPIPTNPDEPTESPDPDTNPDPTAPVEIPSIDPYISPIPRPDFFPESAPIPDPDPDPDPKKKIAPQAKKDPMYVPQPDPDPDIDPSSDPLPDPEPAPPPPPPPPPDGITPPIIFPPTGFPSPIPSSGSGLIHVYNPTNAQLVAFGNWLWVTYADPSIQKLWNNPFDGVISAHELYATPATDGTDTIKSGFLDSGISSALVRVRYTTINCGSVVIPEYYQNYLDYSPYSRAYAYLPFIGIVDLDVDDIVGHSVNITYHVDSYNGSCIAQITVAKENYENTCYQFSGNCAVELPLAGGSQAAIRAGMISAAAYTIGGTINGAVKGGLAGGATGAIGGLANGIANVVSQKSTVQHSGSFGASYGAMGIKKPFIIIRRPIQKEVTGYERDYGYPAHKRVVVGTCSGYLRVREVNVMSSLATDEEKLKIEELLKEGVYV